MSWEILLGLWCDSAGVERNAQARYRVHVAIPTAKLPSGRHFKVNVHGGGNLIPLQVLSAG
jgi:hypothetical protein